VIAAECEDFKIRRWDLTGRELAQVPTSQYLRIASLSPDDKILAAGHMRGVLGLFDMATGALLVEKKLHDHQIYGVMWNATGLLATGSLDNTVKVWTPKLELVKQFRIDGDDGVLRSIISPDGTIALAGAQDGTLYSWDIASGKRLGKVKEHSGPVWGLAYAPDGKHVYTAGEDGAFLIWDTATWTKSATLVGPAGTHAVDPGEGSGGPLAVSRDGKTAVTGYRNGALIVWDLETKAIRYRIGGGARDAGSCSDVAQQRWVDETHRKIVQTACDQQPDAYYARIAALAHKRLDNVDVVSEWATPSP
jgi:WD40 repeat protein